MKFMIYGSGNAREYATFRRLREECAGEPPMLATTSSPGLLAGEPNVHQVSDVDEAVALCRNYCVDHAIVISPNPAFDGAVDRFREEGIQAIGPSAEQATLEQSKIIAGQFAEAAGIPRPFAANARNAGDAIAVLRHHWRPDRPLVVKADGFVDNAAFRTIVPSSLDEALEAVGQICRHVGRDGPFVLQERLEGPELSVHLALDRSGYLMFPPVSDYKRLSSDTDSPMTHGMGAVAHASAPLDPRMTAIDTALRQRIVEPTLEVLRARGLAYAGILYIGVIITADGPRVLEYNVRPGNPEWLCLLELLESPVAELFDALSHDRVMSAAVRFRSGYAVSIFTAGRGYPLSEADPGDSLPIEGLEEAASYARLEGESALRCGEIVLAGSGRVVAATAFHESLDGARDAVLRAIDILTFDGKQFRTDIGLSAPLALK